MVLILGFNTRRRFRKFLTRLQTSCARGNQKDCALLNKGINRVRGYWSRYGNLLPSENRNSMPAPKPKAVKIKTGVTHSHAENFRFIPKVIQKAIRENRPGIMTVDSRSRAAQLLNSGLLPIEQISSPSTIERQGDYIRICKEVDILVEGRTRTSRKVCGAWTRR